MKILSATKENEQMILELTEQTLSDFEDAKAFLVNEDGYWILELNDGSFWACMANEDEVFKDSETAFNWVKERI